jgi:hypothetical protein
MIACPVLTPQQSFSGECIGRDIVQEFPINWFAILAAVIIKQAIGAFWYSPALFGPSWCKLAGV